MIVEGYKRTHDGWLVNVRWSPNEPLFIDRDWLRENIEDYFVTVGCDILVDKEEDAMLLRMTFG